MDNGFPYTADEVDSLIETAPEIDEGQAYADVYDIEGSWVLKVQDTPYAVSGQVFDNMDALASYDIPFPETCATDEIELPGDKYPVYILQKEADAVFADAVENGGAERFLDEIVEMIDYAARRSVVLTDNKPQNYGVFDGRVKRLDIADDELFQEYPAPGDRAGFVEEQFQERLVSAYRGIVRGAIEELDVPADRIEQRVAGSADFLNEDFDLDYAMLAR
ncbi:MAG: hypothetical protein SVU32_01660, partial [Candidatus Nanohaloarchaea archaeon]|nr:hypothetical protein [Candidatus Nanohaloarchaea archaeon]